RNNEDKNIHDPLRNRKSPLEIGRLSPVRLCGRGRCMLRSLLLFMLTVSPLPLAAAERGVWLCIGPEHLLAEAGPVAELRASQGWAVRRSSALVADAIAAETVKPAAILLLGDDST